MNLSDLMSAIPRTEPVPSTQQIVDEHRERLLRKVYHGKITPAFAEAVCRRMGYPPFQRLPDSFLVDTDTAAMWTVEMVAIWFATRGDDRPLHRHVYKRCRTYRCWRPNTSHDFEDTCALPMGHYLTTPERTHLFQSFIDFEGVVQNFPHEENWYPRLQRYLIDGVITASGYRITTEGNIRERIESSYWIGNPPGN